MAYFVTMKGREMIVARMKGASPTQGEPLNIGWGTNPASLAAANTDIAPFTEASESRVAGTSSIANTTTTVNDTYQVTGTMTVAGSGKTIGEVFLSDSTTKPSTQTVAAGGVVASGTSTTLNTSGTFSPGNNNYIQIRTEVMQVTAGSGTTALTVVRMNNLAANIGGGGGNIATITAGDVIQPGNPPGQTGITGGSLLLHGSFTGLALNVGDSIAFTLNVSVSS